MPRPSRVYSTHIRSLGVSPIVFSPLPEDDPDRPRQARPSRNGLLIALRDRRAALMHVVVRLGHSLQTKHQRPGIPFPLRLFGPPRHVPQRPHELSLQLPRLQDPELTRPPLRPTGARRGITHREPGILERPRPLTPHVRRNPGNAVTRITQNPLDDLVHPEHDPDEPAPETTPPTRRAITWGSTRAAGPPDSRKHPARARRPPRSPARRHRSHPRPRRPAPRAEGHRLESPW